MSSIRGHNDTLVQDANNSSLCIQQRHTFKLVPHRPHHADRASDLASAPIGFGTEVAQAIRSQVSLTNLNIHGAPGFKPLHFQVFADCRVGKVKNLVAGRLELLNQDPQDFRLRYEGRILDD